MEAATFFHRSRDLSLMLADDFAFGQDTAATDTRPARADKTRRTRRQMTPSEGAVRAQEIPRTRETRRGPNDPTEAGTSETARRRRTGATKPTKSRPRVGGKETKTQRKQGRTGGSAKRTGAAKPKKAKQRTGAKAGGGRKRGKPKTSGARVKTQPATKTRTGAGKAGGKRSR